MGTKLSKETIELGKTTGVSLERSTAEVRDEIPKIKRLSCLTSDYYFEKKEVAYGGFSRFYVGCDRNGTACGIREVRLLPPKGNCGFKAYSDDQRWERNVSHPGDIINEARAQNAVGGQYGPTTLEVVVNEKGSKAYFIQPMFSGSLMASSVDASEESPHVRLQNAMSNHLGVYGRYLISELSAGVARIREAGWLHLDIKPTNILYLDNKLYIADFGHAFKGQKQRAPRGTESYRAPEQVGDNLNTPAADVWALAVSVIECVDCHLLRGLSNSRSANATTIVSYNNWRRVCDDKDKAGLPRPYHPNFTPLFDHLKQMNKPLEALLWDMLCVEPNNRISIKDVIHRASASNFALTQDERQIMDAAMDNLPNPSNEYRRLHESLVERLQEHGLLKPPATR